jgi:hypothetical protein
MKQMKTEVLNLKKSKIQVLIKYWENCIVGPCGMQ